MRLWGAGKGTGGGQGGGAESPPRPTGYGPGMPKPLPDSPRSPDTPRFPHAFPFDPSYGYAPEALRAIGAPGDPGAVGDPGTVGGPGAAEGPGGAAGAGAPESPGAPEDFAAFWRARHRVARAVDPAPEVGPLEEERDGARIYGVRFTSVGGVRLGGWLVLPPEGEPVRRGLVIGHGYGGRDAPGPDVPLPVPGAAALLPCVRGMGERSRVAGIPEAADAHVLHGIASRDTYVLGDCVADLWCAASALLALAPTVRRLGYAGESLGGGLGALALPWDERFACGQLKVPTFGHYPLRLTLPSVGSGESVRTYHTRHPEVAHVLRYFDAATAASRIGCPVLTAPALFDPAVPPPGQFAVANAAPGPVHVLTAGHFAHPGEADELTGLRAATADFLTAHLG